MYQLALACVLANAQASLGFVLASGLFLTDVLPSGTPVIKDLLFCIYRLLNSRDTSANLLQSGGILDEFKYKLLSHSNHTFITGDHKAVAIKLRISAYRSILAQYI